MAGFGKSVKSAVVISPPEDCWEQIQSIREKYDKAYKRWMPHINLLYPFIEDSGTNFSQAQTRFSEGLANIEPFTVVFNKESFGFFKHSKNCTLWLKPLMKNKVGLLDSDLAEPVQRSASSVLRPEPKPDMSHTVDPTLRQEVSGINHLPEPKIVATETSTPTPSLSDLKDAIWNPGDTDHVVECTSHVTPVESNHQSQQNICDDTEAAGEWVQVPSKQRQKKQSTEKRDLITMNLTPPKASQKNQSCANDTDSTSSFHPSVIKIQRHLVEMFPECNDLSTRGPAGFQPHLSLGQFKAKEVNRFMEEFKATWVDIEFEVNEIYLISRKDFDDPFHIQQSVPFSGTR